LDSSVFLYNIRKIEETDRKWIRDFLVKEWQSPLVVTRGVIHQADSLPGFIAEIDGCKQGLITYNIKVSQCEIVTLNSLVEKQGIGSGLIDTVRKEVFTLGCKRLWLITTNDNVGGIKFYKKRGFKVAAIHKNAVSESRRLKPEIPLTGIDGVPICDEIEMELLFE
jgi:GNAT superfamily N-acetyltransferase